MSKQDIRPRGAEGISHPRTLAKPLLTVNAPSTNPPADAFSAAEQWHIQFCAAAEAAEGYFFPTGLRRAFEQLPVSAQPDFLDAIGALFMGFHVIGRPIPGRQNLREDVALSNLPPDQQDARAHQIELLENERGRAE